MTGGCHVYLLRAGSYAKIGIADDITRRVAQLQTACPERIVVESHKLVCCRAHALQIEAELHRWPTHLNWRTSGEWFRGNVQIESHFEFYYGHRVSLCADAKAVEAMARRFIGLPMVLGSEENPDSSMLPMGDDIAELAPPSDSDGDVHLGYAMSYVEPDYNEYKVVGWYERVGDTLKMVSFNGT